MKKISQNSFESTASVSPKNIRVLKFGGSSLGTPGAINDVARVVRETSKKCRVVVVVSALEGVTDRLEALVHNIMNGGADDALSQLLFLYRRHLESAQELLPKSLLKSYREVLGNEFGVVVPSIRRIRQTAGSIFDAETVLAAGERFSAPLISAVLKNAGLNASHVDASRLICIQNPNKRRVNRDETSRLIQSWYAGISESSIPVLTGFIGSSACGRTVTLGRGGSDYTAALVASSLAAEVLERWTDVDGLYTADPFRCPDAKRLETLSLEDAALLNRSNKLGMHRHTLEPLVQSRTPLHVRSFRHRGIGTLVVPEPVTVGERSHS
jgi:aspartate kinase